MTGAGEIEEARSRDAQARELALDVTQSLLLQAPAGSGKTTVLTARFLALLAVADRPEEILAITFTRKAAAEMRHRVLLALDAAQEGRSIAGIPQGLLDRVRGRDAELGWQLGRNAGRLRIETIDALCYRLASALPVASRSMPALQITTVPGPLYRRAARASLRSALRESERADPVRRLLDRLDNRWMRLESLVAGMLERRSHWLPRVLSAHEAGLSRRIVESLESVVRTELAGIIRMMPASSLPEAEALLCLEGTFADPCLDAEPGHLAHWRALARLVLTEEGEWRVAIRLPSNSGIADRDAFRHRLREWIGAHRSNVSVLEALRLAAALPDAGLSEDDARTIEALAAVLTAAVAELHVQFAEAGRVDYAFVAGAAREALSEQGSPSDLALRTSDRLRHILIDEFQDTSLEQFDLLEALTADWSDGDGRTLFVVGDPMQSIYQFREAEVGLFLRARDRGVAAIRLRPLQLRRNFRSNAGLIRWTNDHFARLFPARDDPRLTAVRYLTAAPATPNAESSDQPAVSLHRIAAGRRGIEADRVVDIVRAERRRSASARIAVLVAARQHAASIVARLRAAGIALRGVDLELLQQRPAVRDLAALARVVMHPADRTAWLALLRAPACGLELEALEQFFRSDQADLMAVLEAVLQSAPASLRPRLERLHRALWPSLRGPERGWPAWRRVASCWLRLGGPAFHPGATDRLDEQRFLDALATHEEPSALVGDGMARLTDRLFSTAAPTEGAVEIMTIHAAKGLEWDVVILPCLERRGAGDPDPLLHWIDLPRPGGGSDLLLAPIRASDGAEDGPTGIYIKSLRRIRLELERVRQLYVAVTRARESLHLLAAPEVDAGTGELKSPRQGSLLASLWPAVEAEFRALKEAAESPEVTRARPNAIPWKRLPPMWQPALPPASPEIQRLRLVASPRAGADSPEYSWVGLAARAVGTIVHAELRRLASAAELPAPDLIGRDTGAYRGWLTELGVAAGEQPAAESTIFEALRRTLNDARGRWLLARGHPVAQSEWRLTGLHDGRIVNVVFDRMLVDDAGDRWIVDYKTSRHEGGALGQFIEQEAERYRPQLVRYAAIAAGLGPQRVRTALYFPLLGVFREITEEPAAASQ